MDMHRKQVSMCPVLSRKSDGFIMIVTLMMLALGVVIVTFMASRTSTYVPYVYNRLERSQAIELAMGGIQLAMSQLANADIVEKVDKQDGSSQPQAQQPQQNQQQQSQGGQQKPQVQQLSSAGQRAQAMLNNLMPILNTWQQFSFKEDRDGVDGEIKICIMSESGKINLNELYDFDKHALKGDQNAQVEISQWLKEILAKIAKLASMPDLFEPLMTEFKNRTTKFRDPTELLLVQEFSSFRSNLFFDPAKSQDKLLFLTDIFTVWSRERTLDPWLLSESVKSLLGVEGGKAPEDIDSRVKAFKGAYTWPGDWATLFGKAYKKEWNALPKGTSAVMATRFDPKVFSVLVSGTVGETEQRLYAIIERGRIDQDLTKSAGVTIRKIYWV